MPPLKSEQFADIRGREILGGEKASYGEKPMNLTKVRQLLPDYSCYAAA